MAGYIARRYYDYAEVIDSIELRQKIRIYLVRTLKDVEQSKDTDTMEAVGRLYFSGVGFDQDVSKACDLWQKAFEMSKYASTFAYKIATCYFSGMGREKDQKMAFGILDYANIPIQKYQADIQYYEAKKNSRTDSFSVNWFQIDNLIVKTLQAYVGEQMRSHL